MSIVGDISGQEVLGWHMLVVTTPGMERPGNHPKGSGASLVCSAQSSECTWWWLVCFLPVVFLLLVPFSISLFIWLPRLPPPLQKYCRVSVPSTPCHHWWVSQQQDKIPGFQESPLPGGAQRMCWPCSRSSSEWEPWAAQRCCLSKDEQNWSLLLGVVPALGQLPNG